VPRWLETEWPLDSIESASGMTREPDAGSYTDQDHAGRGQGIDLIAGAAQFRDQASGVLAQPGSATPD
jgi:hypothetical protein